jgi:hypothetical protein
LFCRHNYNTPILLFLAKKATYIQKIFTQLLERKIVASIGQALINLLMTLLDKTDKKIANIQEYKDIVRVYSRVGFSPPIY